ncbi:Fe2+-dependent dioxygenase [Methylocapsa sp. D3K7]|uniref:Fe2+-dependent dioxygenase n=1 Tax=Methylocapsa sp. D3K7 TaxID=3041435 RepID=UPI00244E6314|nr:Fe2+-dependent dioxygenase [Methylocapsa sp. D3K7]WGJ13132.1 Fe2+-dependent dioxygenase [Methylocapsa sp. D3K7]
MIVHIPDVLDQTQLAQCREAMERAAWIDGRATAGHQSKQVKNNLQLAEGGPEHRELGDMVIRALQRSPLFISAVLPHTVFPPLFNRYEAGMGFGLHVDNAIRQTVDGGIRIRTDVSATLFLSSPDEYEGGELAVEDSYGSHTVKLPAGDLVVYPADSRHEVAPITRGSRLASFFWIQSLIPDKTRRALLFDLDATIIQLTKDVPGHSALVSLTATYHNLLRQWTQV